MPPVTHLGAAVQMPGGGGLTNRAAPGFTRRSSRCGRKPLTAREVGTGEEAKYLGIVDRRALEHRFRRAGHDHETPPPDGVTHEEMIELQKMLFHHDIVESGRWLLDFMPDVTSVDAPEYVVIVTADSHVSLKS